MASISKSNNAGGDGSITEWTSFKESKGRVESYVSEVFAKAARRVHETAGDVLDDYVTCVKLLIKLMEESSGFTVAVYEKDYLSKYAGLIKAKMLCSFSTIFLAIFNRLDQQSVDWLKEEKSAPDVNLLSESEKSIKLLDGNVEMMDDDLQSDINKLKEGHLHYFQSLLHEFQQTQNEIQAYLDANKEDENVHREMRLQTEDHLLRLNKLYEDVKSTISSAVVDMHSLNKLARSFYQTLGTLEEAISWLNADFCKLVDRSEEDLQKKWLEATDYMDEHPLVRRGKEEKEEYEKAKADSDMQWEQMKFSSGLPF